MLTDRRGCPKGQGPNPASFPVCVAGKVRPELLLQKYSRGQAGQMYPGSRALESCSFEPGTGIGREFADWNWGSFQTRMRSWSPAAAGLNSSAWWSLSISLQCKIPTFCSVTKANSSALLCNVINVRLTNSTPLKCFFFIIACDVVRCT